MSIEEKVAAVLAPWVHVAKQADVVVLIGVSGGVDSMVLFDVLEHLRHTLVFRLVACHVHHGLRGTEADRDARAVQNFALQRHVEFRMMHVDVLQNRLPGESEEMAARRLRYEALKNVADEYESCILVTAHHANDQVETMLDRILRGTGPSGLRAMREVRPIGRHILVRPLLTLYKNDLIQYARTRNLPFVEDSSNADLRYRRNRIRRELLPYLRTSFNPKVDHALLQLGRIVADEDQYLTGVAREHMLACTRRTHDGTLIAREDLLRLPIALQRRVIKLVLEGIDESVTWQYAEIENLLELVRSEKTRRMMLPHDWMVFTTVDFLHIGRFASRGDSEEFPWNPFPLDWSSFFSFLRFHWQVEAKVVKRPIAYPTSHFEAFFARSREECFIFRPWRVGDRIEPLGMKGSKLVSDLFTEGKVERVLRPYYPLLTLGDEILWVPGLCRSRSHLVDSKTEFVQQIVFRV
ncbi:tRNA lysidine(34) synthetase TilS [Sulfoacidibacillus thermotolerans]|uniref:tRNA(Ile)-lysidine synthase n=1 Tax=Sulfoacidibacillus thermotolerans TaxID=1765684 RepID=A0A2U3DB06_SULT2|nr:tRNA lysidine(34) synthetase TilS [Sulfoacidibacillus thermotolerans]PWI58461.1 tRNA lysidine(34) synthetase TilS [Sulfoacidibacillus thermotolerans]